MGFLEEAAPAEQQAVVWGGSRREGGTRPGQPERVQRRNPSHRKEAGSDEEGGLAQQGRGVWAARKPLDFFLFSFVTRLRFISGFRFPMFQALRQVLRLDCYISHSEQMHFGSLFIPIR